MSRNRIHTHLSRFKSTCAVYVTEVADKTITNSMNTTSVETSQRYEDLFAFRNRKSTFKLNEFGCVNETNENRQMYFPNQIDIMYCIYLICY